MATAEEIKKARERARNIEFDQGLKPGSTDERFILALAGDESASQSLSDEVEKKSTKKTTGGGSKAPTSVEAQKQAILKAQKDAFKSRITGERDRALGTIKAEEEKVAPAFRKAKISEKIASEKGSKALEDLLASKGLLESGKLVRAEGGRRAALRTTLGELGAGETEALADIERRRTETTTAADRALSEGLGNIDLAQMQENLQGITASQISQQEAQQASLAEQKEFENKVALKNIDAQIAEANAVGDSARAIQLAQIKNGLEQENIQLRGVIDASNIRLRDELDPGSDGVGNSTISSFQAGLDSQINALGGFPDPDQVKEIIITQAEALQSQGASDAQITNFLAANGIIIPATGQPVATAPVVPAPITPGLQGLLNIGPTR